MIPKSLIEIYIKGGHFWFRNISELMVLNAVSHHKAIGLNWEFIKWELIGKECSFSDMCEFLEIV